MSARERNGPRWRVGGRSLQRGNIARGGAAARQSGVRQRGVTVPVSLERHTRHRHGAARQRGISPVADRRL